MIVFLIEQYYDELFEAYYEIEKSIEQQRLLKRNAISVDELYLSEIK